VGFDLILVMQPNQYLRLLLICSLRPLPASFELDLPQSENTLPFELFSIIKLFAPGFIWLHLLLQVSIMETADAEPQMKVSF
jgi:hypothetical protein